MTVLITTQRLRLRSFQPDDLDVYWRVVYGDAAVMVYMPGGVPRSREKTSEVLEFSIEHEREHGFSLWAVEILADSSFLGHCGLIHLKTGEVEIAYALGKSAWGQGYASEAARAALGYGFEQANLAYILALADPDNLASQRVMQKIGMRGLGFTEAYYQARLALYRMDRADWSGGQISSISG